MKEEKIEWVENPTIPKVVLKVVYVIIILVIVVISTLHFLLGFKNLFQFFTPYILFILTIIMVFLFGLFITPRQVGFSAKGVFFRYRRGNVKSIGWDEIYKVELFPPPTKKITPYKDEESGGGKIFLKSGKVPLISISYDIACEIRRRHEEYKREKGFL